MADPGKTVQQAVLDLLRYIGITELSQTTVTGVQALNRPAVFDDDVSKALDAVNAAQMVCFSKLNSEYRRSDRASLFRAPQGIVLNTVNHSKTVTVTGMDVAIWMLGCSILIPGDNYLNEISSIALQPHNTLTVRRIYQGATQTGVNATLYGDAALMDSDIMSILEPVEIMPNRMLAAAQSKAHFDRFSYQINSKMSPWNQIQKTIGMPVLYYVQGLFDSTVNYSPLLLKLNPMPAQELSVQYTAEVGPVKFTLDDVGNDNNNDPGTQFTSVPATWVESVLMPIARKYFIVHPAFKNSTAVAEINAQYALAMKLIEGSEITPLVTARRAIFN